MTHRGAATRREGGRGSRNHWNTFTCQSTTHSVRAAFALEATVTQPSHNRSSVGEETRLPSTPEGRRRRRTSPVVQRAKRRFSGVFVVWGGEKPFCLWRHKVSWHVIALVWWGNLSTKIHLKKQQRNSLKTEGENLFCGPEPPFISWLFDLSTNVTPNVRFNLKTHPSLFLIPAKWWENLSK